MTEYAAGGYVGSAPVRAVIRRGEYVIPSSALCHDATCLDLNCPGHQPRGDSQQRDA